MPKYLRRLASLYIAMLLLLSLYLSFVRRHPADAQGVALFERDISGQISLRTNYFNGDTSPSRPIFQSYAAFPVRSVAQDEAWLYFIGYRSSPGGADLYRVRYNGYPVEQLTFSPELHESTATLSPDGQWLYTVAPSSPKLSLLTKMRPDGSNAQLVSEFSGTIVEKLYLSGDNLILATYQGLYRVSTNGGALDSLPMPLTGIIALSQDGERALLTTDPQRQEHLYFGALNSPDVEMIYATDNAWGSYWLEAEQALLIRENNGQFEQLYRLSLTDGTKTPLHPATGNQYLTALSADKKWLLYVQEEAIDQRYFDALRVDGTAYRRIESDLTRFYYAAWLPIIDRAWHPFTLILMSLSLLGILLFFSQFALQKGQRFFPIREKLHFHLTRHKTAHGIDT